MRKPKLLHIILLWCCFFAHAGYAAGTRTSVFYPLPSLSQGKVFATKQLFVAEHGGIWIHDVHGDIYFLMALIFYRAEAAFSPNLTIT
ncbi:hypothetical protein JCM19233_5504 [Vibrio astriarenae]|nr:hypothetical protein JCM19233_5504 [Vibrio sp. C7]